MSASEHEPGAHDSRSGKPVTGPLPDPQAWRALAAMLVGFFMILVDQTIVAVASEAFYHELSAGPNEIIWVTSAYLLAFVVPLLFTGRLGDQIGAKKVTMAGLVVFTLASLWCGLASSVHWLICARVVQGFGAALISPQSLAVITRVFAPAARGAAMGVWGAAAGIATMVGPIAGGLLVDSVGWEWVFFVNIPLGVLGVILVWRWVPELPTSAHSYDLPGIALSAIGMFLIVFGVQQGATHDWSAGIIAMIFVGLAVLLLFVFWQAVTRSEPLIPLRVFTDRNFAVGNIAIAAMGFAVGGTMVPIMMYLQISAHFSAVQSGLMLVPMAAVSGLLAPFVGRLADRVDPRLLTAIGYGAMALALFWIALLLSGHLPALFYRGGTVGSFFGPMVMLGVGNGFVWAPTSTTAMRTLDVRLAGAGSGVYNTTRQVGAVLGSAAIGALWQTRAAAVAQQPTAGIDPLVKGLADAMVLPAIVILCGGIATMAFRTPQLRKARVATAN